MKILVIAATSFEIQIAKDALVLNEEIVFEVVGVGILATAFLLQKAITKYSPKYIFQIGIAGCFDKTVPLGKVVVVKEEIVGDLGVEESNEWKDVFDLELANPNQSPYENGILYNHTLSNFSVNNLDFVRAITVNEITTRPERISQLYNKYQPILESMEGAALHYIGNECSITYMQIRGISNYIGERDKSKWKIKEAISNTNEALLKIINDILVFR
jgi:futalosine hydrolase